MALASDSPWRWPRRTIKTRGSGRELGFACVSGSTSHATEVVDEVERFVWSFPESEVIDVRRDWLEVD